MARHAVTATEPALALEGLSKSFQGVRALSDVDFKLVPGEIHALLGQNGSGKSTLIKILAGYHKPDAGARARLRGEPFELGSAVAARQGGIRFIHQDLALLGDLNAVDNIAVSGNYAGRWWLSDRAERKAAQAVLDDYEVELDLTVPVRTLPAATRTAVAIVRALHEGVGKDGILVLDEPTAALPAREVSHLFGLINTVRRRGATIIYVTHRLGEVFEIADRVTVLRDGRRVDTCPVASLSHDDLVELIIGRRLDALYPPTPDPQSDVVLEVRDLTGQLVEGLDLDVRRGEIVGITGLVGSGYEEVLQLIFGARERERGQVAVDGRTLDKPSPRASIAEGIAFAPADRQTLSAIPSWTVRENVTLPKLQSYGPLRWMSERREREDAREWLAKLGVVPLRPELRFSALSGGNQQRAVMARWLRSGAKVFLLEDPTIGVDTAAKRAIYDALNAAAADGASILLVTSDAEEACAICDRVVVMRQGAVGAVLEGELRTVDRVLREGMSGTPAAETRSTHE